MKLSRNEWVELIRKAGSGMTFKEISLNDCITGPDATIDSLDFLNFLIKLEQLLSEKAGRFYPVVTEETLSRILERATRVDDIIGILEASDEAS